MGIRVGTIIISPEVGELLSAQAGGAWTIINPEAGFEAAAYFPSNHQTLRWGSDIKLGDTSHGQKFQILIL